MNSSSPSNKNNCNHISFILFICLSFCVLSIASCIGLQQRTGKEKTANIMPLRERAKVQNEWLKWRFENILPSIMKDSGIDMWLVLIREYNEDPMYFTLTPQPSIYSYRTTILIFRYKKEDNTVERLSAARYDNTWYKGIWKDPNKGQFEALAEYIKKEDPQKIGINISENWNLADGLIVTLKKKLDEALGPQLSGRLVSAEQICNNWLQLRSPQEIEEYKNICRIAHEIIADFYSRKAITPDKTTTEELRWWIRQRIESAGLDVWFQPRMDIQRRKEDAEKYKDSPNIIHKGDLLHCDVGIKYLGLCTDMQYQAYVCKDGENDAPAGLKEALKKTVEFNKVIRGEFKEGLTGQQVTDNIVQKAKAANLKTDIMCHSIGNFGHSSAVRIDTRPASQVAEENPAQRQYPLVLEAAYSLEYCCRFLIPEWNNQNVEIWFEDDIAFTKDGCNFLDTPFEKFFIIK